MDVTQVETAAAAALDMKAYHPHSHLAHSSLLIQALKLIRWDLHLLWLIYRSKSATCKCE